MKYKRKAMLGALTAVVILMMSPLLLADLVGSNGKVTMIRVHELGSKYGPPKDQIDVEVVFTLSGNSDKAFGFQLRNDNNLYVRQGMLDLLRDAMANNWTVYVEYFVADQEFPKKNMVVYRLVVKK